MTSHLNTTEHRENTALRHRVAELEQQLRDIQAREAALISGQQVLQSIVDSVPYALYWKDRELVYRGCNQFFATDLGLMATSEIIGKTDADLAWHADEVEGFRMIDQRVIETDTAEQDTDETTIHLDGTQEWFETHKIPLHDAQGGVVGVLGTYANITERKRAAEAIRQSVLQQSALQQEVIAAQQTALRELNTPLIPIMEGVVAMPLVGTIDSNRAQQIMETLLEGIGELQADIALLDITGVRVVDTQVANALIRTAQAAQLLGAQVILTGMSAEVAQSIVQLGVDLRDIVTRSNFQGGIAYAQERIRGEGVIDGLFAWQRVARPA